MGMQTYGGGDVADTDLDNVFYTRPSDAEMDGGKRRAHHRSRVLSKRRNAVTKRRGGADQPDADFDTIFGQTGQATGGKRSRRKSNKSRRRQNRGFSTRRRKSLRRGGHSWSNVGVDRVRRSLQNGKIVETGRLKDYNIYRGAY